MKIYLDHSATTPLDKAVKDAMEPYWSGIYGNPSSIHSFGQAALAGVDQARAEAADFLNCDTSEIVFTSGATESDNLAIKGVIKALKNKGLKDMHIIASMVEHDAVLEPLMELQKDGLGVTHLKVDKRGIVDMEHLQKSIRENTVLISIMWVNSEVGAIMPVREIGKLIKKENARRLKAWKNTRPRERGGKPQPIYFHTDATQGVNFVNCDVKWNYIDLLSLSSHKIYGPKGVGVLYKKEGVPLEAISRGGHHENNLRSGTLNVTGIVGLGAALKQIGRGEKGEASKEQIKNSKSMAQLRDRLVKGIEKNIPDVELNTDRGASTAAHAHFSFMGVEGEALLISLDMEGIAVSTGSACAAGTLKASHVLLAMGIEREVAHYSIRFTLGKHTTKAQIDEVIKKLPPIVKRLRDMNPIYKK